MVQSQNISAALPCACPHAIQTIGMVLLALAFGLRSAMAQQEPVGRATDSSGFEQELARELNLARQSPGTYAAFLELMKPHYAGNLYQPPGLTPTATQEGLRAVNEAIRFLHAARPLPALRLSRGMSLGARQHVKDIGPRGATGHQGSHGSQPGDRVNRYGTWQGTMGENIAYGNDTAREVVTSFIIDDGVPSRGHRKSLFDAAFRVMGVACGTHAQYRSVCVVTFAGAYTEKDGTP